MRRYTYVAVDPNGSEARGTLQVADPLEAVRRIKEMGLFPTRVLEDPGSTGARATPRQKSKPARAQWIGRVNSSQLAVFTRQLATLVEAGMPLLRGLRILQEQTDSRALKHILEEVANSIEGGNSLAEALSAFPRTFNRLYVNMVRAGELAGALDVTLRRLSEFMEKARRIRSKVQSAMFYPCAVMVVATSIVGILMTFVVPRFRAVFDGLMNNQPLPAFTRFVFSISEALRHHLVLILGCLAAGIVLGLLARRTEIGRWLFDALKLSLPVLGPLFRKASISRFARTLGTLVASGVPILQALTIVKETAGNLLVARVIGRVHDNVKQGEPIAPTLKSSRIFPAIVAGMVDVGEQTGALPDLLMKIADSCDEEVDNAAGAITSLLEPIMIVVLALVVGSIVIAMFLPLIYMIQTGFDTPGGKED